VNPTTSIQPTQSSGPLPSDGSNGGSSSHSGLSSGAVAGMYVYTFLLMHMEIGILMPSSSSQGNSLQSTSNQFRILLHK
jgi:hypothetical protein